ncbi:MAG: hypothetical protein ACP5I4_03330 [Oceanipulchritudo sp.]
MPRQISEILLLHHSHTDIGYTHGQAALWELQSRFIERAILLCEETAGHAPEERFHWTCECTAPLLRWMSTAEAGEINRFRACVERGQIGAGALHLHYTPLIPAAAYWQSLRPLSRLRRELGLPLKVGLSHDVNGLPWPVTGLLQQAGLELLVMAANIVYGAHPLTRPLVFNWIGPDGKPLLCMNAEHYNAFSRETNFHLGDTGRMARGLHGYLERKLPEDWPYDFAFLTATHPHFADNNPPVPELLAMVRRWNAEGREPFIRLVQPEELLRRIRGAGVEIPSHAGDWTDYWNFGCGSSAAETMVNRANHGRLRASSLLASAGATGDARTHRAMQRARELALLWNEHTWTASRTLAGTAADELRSQWIQKATNCWTAQSLSTFALREQLEQVSGEQKGRKVGGLLLYNPSPLERREGIRLPGLLADSFWTGSPVGDGHTPEGEAREGRREWDHLESRLHQLEQLKLRLDGTERWTEPLSVEPYSVRWIPASAVRPSPRRRKSLDPALGSTSCNGLFLRWDPAGGGILEAGDENAGVRLKAGRYPVFGYVHESPEPGQISPEYSGREAFFNFDWDRIHADVPGWRTDWRARLRGPTKLVDLEIHDDAEGVSLKQAWEAPGVDKLVQRTVLLRDRRSIRFEASFRMRRTETPESVCFVFPSTLGIGWRAHFDTADIPLEIETEQLPGVNLDFVTVGNWICAHDSSGALLLACPDAPLVQVGDFSFARRRRCIPREPQPLLIGWATNNYWMTNFPPSQPGPVTVRYEMSFPDEYDPCRCSRLATALAQPLDWHPVMGACPDKAMRLAAVEPPDLRILDLWKDGQDWRGLLANEASEAMDTGVCLPPGGLAWNGRLQGREIREVILGEGCSG